MIMSALALLLTLTACICMGKQRQKNNSAEQAIAALWKEYDQASRADRPQKMASLLTEIKSLAASARSAWHFYRACREYVDTESMRNWKLRDTLEAGFRKEIEAYDEPLLTMLMKSESEGLQTGRLLDYVHTQETRMKKARNEDVYLQRMSFPTSGDLYPIMLPYIRSDYEFALWELLPESYAELKDLLADAYPQRAFAEWLYAYDHLSDTDGARYEEMKRLASRYEGRAISLLPLQSLMAEEFENLKERNATSEDYHAFRDALLACEKKRASYREGIDADIAKTCKRFEYMLDVLGKKGLAMSINDGECTLSLRNLDRVKVSVSASGKSVYDTVLVNPMRSLYAYDTLRFALPLLDDGEYLVRCMDGAAELGSCTYRKYTLSLAVRQSPEGHAVYAADYMSGCPVGKVDLVLYKGDRQVDVSDDFVMDGFTVLPEEISEIISGKAGSGYYLQCIAKDAQGRQLKSRKIFLFSGEESTGHDMTVRNALVMTDRAAFNPGDTVRFKTVVYDQQPDASMSVSKEGSEVVARLIDPQGKVLNDKKLTLNAYGSADGAFSLSGPARNGICRIEVLSGDILIGSASFRVDEFVLPSYDLVFDQSDQIYLPGDTVRVSGRVKSYSGHGLASVSLDARIIRNGVMQTGMPLLLEPDGRFGLEFHADCGADADYAGYEVKVRLVDATGETLEFSHYEQISRHMNLSLSLLNAAEGDVVWTDDASGHVPSVILSDDRAELMMSLIRSGGAVADVPVSYELRDGKGLVLKGVQTSGEVLELDFSSLPSALYEFVAKVSVIDGYGRVTEAGSKMKIIRMRASDKSLDASVQTVLCVESEEYPSVCLAAGDGPVWAIFELFSDKGLRLEWKMVYLEGKRGEDNSLVKISYPYKDLYSDGVRMNMFYFRNGRSNSWTHVWNRPVKQSPVSLEFSRFTDMALPSSECSIGIAAPEGTEVLASVFDASSEKIMSNEWRPPYIERTKVVQPYLRSVCGTDSNDFDVIVGEACHDSFKGVENEKAIGYGARLRGINGSAPVREDFSTTLAFEPYLYPSAAGEAELMFRTSDKLSTFVVSLFAHDISLNIAVLRRNLVVTLPLKVSLAAPKYLHEGDVYVLKASVSNNSDLDVAGVINLETYGCSDYKGHEPMCISSREMSVSAGGTADADFEIIVPSLDTLGLKLTFASEGVSDAIFVAVPVFPAEQTLMEAHSAVLLPGMSEEVLLDSLRASFRNVSPAGAEYSEVSIMEMLDAALPLVKEAESRDAVSQSEAMYLNLLAARSSVREHVEAAMNAVEKLVACSDAGGGFAWLEGMNPSPVVTAVVLERYAGLRDRGFLTLVSEEMGEDALDEFDEAVTAAVEYLDHSFFDPSRRPAWYGGLSILQYMAVRSRYAAVPFDLAKAKKTAGASAWRDFVKLAKALLLPSQDKNWTDGAILAKVRMARILLDLTSSDAGQELAASWGLKNVSKMLKSIGREIASLKEYAVAHPSGGVYYPNAVLPWRGLLESEAYAHAQLCDLFRELPEDEELLHIADGIGIWLMLQKETQHWDDDPGFAEAMAAVYSSSAEVKETKVVVLKKRYLKPFREIRSAGNGMTVSVKYYREESSQGAGEAGRRVALKDGDMLDIGDKIVAEYSLWSQENRSFVRLSVPRAALFRPVQQLSGWNRGVWRPLSYGIYRVSPYCYREVKSDRTLYWIDVFPEEKSSIEEEYFVTQAGMFMTPAPEIECLYAPHYRGNDRGGRIFNAK